MKLCGNLCLINEIQTQERDRMFLLMQRYFNGMVRDTFERDLDDKESVIILRDPVSKEIQGFSTLQRLAVVVRNQPVRAVFSGDTIIEKDYWGDVELARIWGRHMLDLVEEEPNIPLYWFLISKGHRTYRFLPAYFHKYYPSYNQVTPQFEEELIATLAEMKFPGLYDRSAGVIKPVVSDCLNEDMAGIENAKLHNPHVRFFLEKNSGYRRGEELACLALISNDNLRPLARSIFSRYGSVGHTLKVPSESSHVEERVSV